MTGATIDQYGAIHCHCGNIPDVEGFTPCHENGTRDESLTDADGPGEWCYLCERCGAVYHWPTMRTVQQ